MEKDKIANPYVMPVVLNGKKFKCLVDTGSACTIIRKSVATKLEVVPKQEHTLLRSFDGSYVASTGDVELEVRVGQPQAVIRGTVVDDEKLLHDCIIGRDFLDLPYVMLVKIGTKVHVTRLGDERRLWS